MLEIHISFFSTGLPSYIKEMFALSVVFPKLFGMLCFSLLWAFSFYRGSVFCPSVHLPIIANVLYPEIISSVDADRSLNVLSPKILHTIYACLICQGKKTKLLGTFCHMSFTFILSWFSFSDPLHLCPSLPPQLYY